MSKPDDEEYAPYNGKVSPSLDGADLERYLKMVNETIGLISCKTSELQLKQKAFLESWKKDVVDQFQKMIDSPEIK